jgi:protein-disulfide isomerase
VAPSSAAVERRRPRWRSPWILGAAAIVVIALVAIAAIQLAPKAGPSGPAAPGTRTSAGILVPATGTPTNVAFARALGRPDAPVRLIVWSDFQCTACREFAEGSLLRLVTDFVVPGQLRIEFRDFAAAGPESVAAAGAARCASDQGKFWPYHDVLFANQGPAESGLLVPARLKAMADAIGLDRTAFDTCLPSGDVFNAVQAETTQARTRGDTAPILDFGPTLFDASADYDTLQGAIEDLLAKASARPSPSSAAASAIP